VTPGDARGARRDPTKRIDEFTAGRAALRKELLEVTQRDPCFGCDLGRTKVRIGKAILDDGADPRELSVVRVFGTEGGGI
jgi:hypothetical protein